MTDLKDSNGNEPLPGQTNILTTIEDRQRWHELGAVQLDPCPSCKKPNAMRPGTIPDPVNDEVYYFAKCRYCGHKEE